MEISEASQEFLGSIIVPGMPRLLRLLRVVFWTSTPLFGVYLALTWPERDRVWPATVLGLSVMFSAFVLLAHPHSSTGALEEGERYVYAAAFLAILIPLAFHIFY